MADKVCKACNGAMKEGETFCRRCGAYEEYQASDKVIALADPSSDKPKKTHSLTLIEIFIVLGIIGMVVLIMMPTRRYGSPTQAREKACYANMRVILGAIEMYNMDHNEMITTRMDDPTKPTSILVREKYLKSPITPAETDCYYRIHGDVSGNGVIVCDNHGTVEGNDER